MDVFAGQRATCIYKKKKRIRLAREVAAAAGSEGAHHTVPRLQLFHLQAADMRHTFTHHEGQVGRGSSCHSWQ
jgi:hypothetical protein